MYLEFIIYGIIQGLTEFIPVSSTAHLKIISSLFGINDPGSSLSAIMQIGSLFALLWYFRKNIIYSFNSNSDKNNHYFISYKLYKSILISTIPIILSGGIVKVFLPKFSESFVRSDLSIALISILMSYIMLLADYSTHRRSADNHHRPQV